MISNYCICKIDNWCASAIWLLAQPYMYLYAFISYCHHQPQHQCQHQPSTSMSAVLYINININRSSVGFQVTTLIDTFDQNNYIQSMVWQCLWFSISMICGLKKQHLNFELHKPTAPFLRPIDNRQSTFMSINKFDVRRIFGDCAQFCSYLSISATLQTK